MAFLNNLNRRIVLASASPRRQQLFRLIFDAFEIFESNIPEQFSVSDEPVDIVRKLAYQKAEQVARSIKDGLIVGADSVVVWRKQILGKPADYTEAARMLRMLGGHSHFVYTGFAIIEKPAATVVVDCVATKVKFKKLSEWEIQRYLEIGQPLDKAGAYGIQNEAALFIEAISGCYYNVMGLPVNAVYEAILSLLQPEQPT